MKKLTVLLFLVVASATYAADISGVYENGNATVTIEKAGPAWRLECDDESAGHTYLSNEKKTITDPFEPTDKCRPKKQLTDNVYRITVTPKTKIECGIIPKPGTLAEFYPDMHPEIKSLSIHPYLFMQFIANKPPFLLVNKPGLFDEDCMLLCKDYKKIK